MQPEQKEESLVALPKSAHMFDRVHELLWEKIASGVIRPSDRLKDSDWCLRLGVSRTPVREAMRKLQQEGVLIPLSQGGYQVKPVSAKDVTELYTCRAALEALAASEATNRLNEAKIAAIQSSIAAGNSAISAGEFDEAFRRNSEFHKLVLQFSENEHLSMLWNSLSRLVVYYRSALLN